MSSKTEIVNIALIHLGVGKEVANIDTENSSEARTARRVYDMALDTVLKEAHWPFATRIVALALIETEPNSDWYYSYRYPSGCLELRRILSGLRQDSRQSKAPFKVASDSSGLLIYTDEEDAQVEYTVRLTNPQLYPSDFVMAFSYFLAGLMAPGVTKGDQFKLGDKAFKMYNYAIGRAIANTANEEARDEEPTSEFQRGRD